MTSDTDNVRHLDDVKPAERRKINALKVKALSEDGAFWLALLLVGARLYPPIEEWARANQDVLIPLYLVIAGHFGIRAVSTVQAGKVLTAGDTTAIAKVER